MKYSSKIEDGVVLKLIRYKNSWYMELIRYMLTTNSGHMKQILNVPVCSLYAKSNNN